MNTTHIRNAILIAMIFAGSFWVNPLAAQTIIKVNEATDGNGRYAMQMVRLALSKIDTRYDFTIDSSEVSQARFDRVKTFADLKSFSFGQGTTWADSDILASNGLNVVRANKYQSLFYMVDGGRFDAFPRGVQEPWGELKSHSDLPLTVEKRIMLVYRMPFYLFTSKTNTKLAADLELGLNRAIADGSFDKIFLNDPLVKDVMEKANLEQRLVFPLDNPTLPKEAPLDRPELWLDIKSLGKPAPAAAIDADAE